MERLAALIGYTIMASGGIALAGVILLCSAVFARKWAWRLWDEMATIYRLETMRYWFQRMKENGRHVMRDAELSNEQKDL